MAEAADLPQFLPQVLPMLEWVEIRRVCLTQQQCSRSLVQAVYQRYLGEAPSSVRARVQRLGDRLNGAQAAQARGSPEALASAAVEVMVLQQCTRVLSENCEKYADLLERVGFTLGDDLEEVSDALLASLDRLQAFASAVARLQAAAEAAPPAGPAARRAVGPVLGGFHGEPLPVLAEVGHISATSTATWSCLPDMGGDGGFGKGGFGDKGKGKGKKGKGKGKGKGKQEEKQWTPMTKLGRLVNDGKITCLEDIYLHSLPIKEPEIIDHFYPPGSLKDEVLKIHPVQKMTSAGQTNRFVCYVLVGDTNGHIGLGSKCAKEVATAIRGGIIAAKINLIPVRRGFWGNRIGLPHTVPMKVHGKCGSVRARLIPAPRGSGIVGSPVMKKMMAFAGISDCFTCSCGHTRTTANFAKATFEALKATYGYLTPDLWKPTNHVKSPFQEWSDYLAQSKQAATYCLPDMGGDGGFGKGGFGDKGKGKGKKGKGKGKGKGKQEEKQWTPMTKLGRLVNDGKITCLEDIYLHSLPIKEPEIIDHFYPPGSLKDEVLKIHPVQKMTSAGQTNRFVCYVLVGDTNGHIGLGSKCAKEVATAIRGGIIAAKINLIPVRRGFWGNRIGLPHTVPMKVHGKCGSVRARLIPAPRGSGIVGSPVMKKMMAFAGISDCFTCSCGHTRTTANFAKATFEALKATYGYLTPDLWKPTNHVKSPFQEWSDYLAQSKQAATY
ncbi:unnamed protein product [Cladocopium goreaui]|uniref:Small ribosomal subunit protein uS5 n=1 Tax=Cladocopium goreaui TaxID=2562237 RepID=A0A9P1CHQ9_9DINO|nr:unnamed protein product [Cladocopium goreaui]